MQVWITVSKLLPNTCMAYDFRCFQNGILILEACK